MDLTRRITALMLSVSLASLSFQSVLPAQAQGATFNLSAGFSGTALAVNAGFSANEIRYKVINQQTGQTDAQNTNPSNFIPLGTKEVEFTYEGALASTKGFRVMSSQFRDSQNNALSSTLHASNFNRLILVPVAGETTLQVQFDILPKIQFQSAASSGAENSSPATFAINLDKAVSEDVTVLVSTANGSGSSGSDYTALTNQLVTISAGQTSKNFSVTILDDTVFEGNETFTISLSSPTRALPGSTSIHTFTILENDTGPVVNFQNANSAGSEGTTSPSFVITLDKSSSLAVSVQVSSSNGSAVAPGDFTAISNQTVTFNAGETSKNISATILNDDIDEPDETFQLTLSSPNNATLGSTTTHTYTIQDNDATPTVQFAATTATINENAGTGNIALALSNPSSQTVTVIANSTGGTAISGTDFTAISAQTISFAAGETTKNLTATITNDTLVEANETFTITLSGPTNATLGTNTTSTVTITDDEPTPIINFQAATSSGTEATTPALINVTLDRASTLSITVKVNSANGTASSGADYTAITDQTLTFAPGETSKTVSVAIAEDTIDEPDEIFTLTLSTPTNANLAASPIHNYTITDNDATPTINFTSTSGAGSEPTTPVVLTITLSNPSSQTVTVLANSANGSASAPGDFTAVTNQTITFNAGETSKTLNVVVIDDSLAEGNETFTVTLSSPTSATLGPSVIHTYTIQDNDLPVISFNTASSAGSEALNPAVITVVLDKPSTQSVTVLVNSANGSATAGTDYTAISNLTLTFNAGVTSQNVSVTIAEDTGIEANETFTLTLSSPTNAVLGSTNPHTYSILDNDGGAAPVINFQSSASSGAESVTSVQYTLVLDKTSNLVITVQVSTANGSATAGSDFTALTNQIITFNAGDLSKLFTVTIADDSTVESNENFTLNLNTANNATIGTTNPTHSYTIVDNDIPVINFQAGSSSGAENVTPANIIITLDKASNQAVTVQVGSTNETALAPSDFTAISNQTITFNAGETSKTVAVTITDDTIGEGSETFRLTLSAAVNANIGTTNPSHVFTITDNDTTAINFSAGASTGAENVSPVNLTVTLSNASTLTVTVIANSANGTALAPGDFTAISAQTITFAPGETSKTLPLTIIDDSTGEASENFSVTLSGAVNATLGGTVTHTATITDNDTPAINFSSAVSSGSENSTPAVFTITLSNASVLSVTVVVNSANGTALSAADYTAISNQAISFNAGETSKTINALILDDTGVENNETFTLTLSGPSNATLGATIVHTYTITDNDGGAASITVNKPQNLVVGEEGSSVTVTVVLGKPPAANVTIAVTSENTGEVTAGPSTLTFTPANGTTAQTVTLTGVADGIEDGNKKVKIKFEKAVSADLQFNGLDPEDIELVNVDRNVSVGPAGGGSGGGGSSGLISIQPAITVISPEGKILDKVSAEPGKEVTIPVEVTDKNPVSSSLTLTLIKDPSKGKAKLVIKKKEAKSIIAELIWTPTSKDLGTHEFVFELRNTFSAKTQSVFVTVKEAVPSTSQPLRSPEPKPSLVKIPAPSKEAELAPSEAENFVRILERRSRCQFADNVSESVITLCSLGLIDYPNTSNDFFEESKALHFEGEAPMNRAEFTKIMVNALFDESDIEAMGQELVEKDIALFPDVGPSEWFSKYIGIAKKYGIVKGYANGRFVPWNAIERSEAFKIMIGIAAERNAKIHEDLEKIQAVLSEDEPWFTAYERLVNLYGGFSTPENIHPGIVLSQRMNRQEGADVLFRVIQNAGIQADSKLSELSEQVAVIRRKEDEGLSKNSDTFS